MPKKTIIYKRDIEYKYAEINLPSSKSISNRLLLLKNIIKNQQITIKNLSNADDSILMIDSLNDINKYLSEAEFKSPLSLYLKNSGTVYRFLTAYLSTVKADFVLDCDQRMKSRPIKALVDALSKVGAKISYLESYGFPPLLIEKSYIEKKASFSVDVSKSSQFASALILISTYFEDGFSIELKGGEYSKSYIKLSLDLLNECGYEYYREKNVIIIDAKKNDLPQLNFVVEPDWSSAAFFYQYIACSEIGSSLFINALEEDSLQGDKILKDVFKEFGVSSKFYNNGLEIVKASRAKQNISIDFSDSPDISIPTICAAAKLNLIGRFTGLKNLKHKESDRIKSLEKNLSKFSYDFRTVSNDEAVLINPCETGYDENIEPIKKSIEIESFDDHRIFMAFALMTDENLNINIDSADAYVKSFPNFFLELEKLGFKSKRL